MEGAGSRFPLGERQGGASPLCTATGLGENKNLIDKVYFYWSCFSRGVQRGSLIQRAWVEKLGH